MPGAYSAARASGPPNDVTATPAKAQALTGRAADVRGGRPAVVPVVRVGKVVTGNVSSSRRRRSSWPAWTAWTARAARCAGRGRGRGVGSGDHRPGRGHQPPLRAEVVAALASGLARGRVTDEVVQRVTVVGHLLGAVGPGDRAQVARLRAAGRGQRAGGRHRRPGRRARARAGGHVHGVLGPQVHRAARPIGQERPRRAGVGREHRPGRRRAEPSSPRPGPSWPGPRATCWRRCCTPPRPAPRPAGIASLTGFGSRASSEWIFFIVSSRAGCRGRAAWAAALSSCLTR